MKLRINKRKNIIRVNRRKLGRSIEERDKKIERRVRALEDRYC